MEHREKCPTEDAGAGLANMDAERLKLSNQVHDGLNRMNNEFVRATFDNHKDPKTGSIVKSSFASALIDLGIRFQSSEIDAIFESRGFNQGLDFQEFSSFVSEPSPIEEWVRSLPLHQLVAHAMPRNDTCLSKDQLRHLCGITRDQLDLSCQVIMDHLAQILKQKLAILAGVYNKLDSHTAATTNEKYQVCKMSVGNINHFHQGLASRLGELRC
jgi:hypothetical protein